jgi:hypothetical protein
MSRLVLYGSGHPSRSPSVRHEIDCASSGFPFRWVPMTPDFRAEAERQSRRPVGVGSYAAFVGSIQRSRHLQTVLFFGHGGADLLKFGETSMIDPAFMSGRSDNLSGSFLAGGRILLYACGTGASPAFLSTLANSWGVRICGISGGVKWCIRWDAARTSITYRGIDRDHYGIPLGSTSLPSCNVCRP